MVPRSIVRQNVRSKMHLCQIERDSEQGGGTEKSKATDEGSTWGNYAMGARNTTFIIFH